MKFWDSYLRGAWMRFERIGFYYQSVEIELYNNLSFGIFRGFVENIMNDLNIRWKYGQTRRNLQYGQFQSQLSTIWIFLAIDK